MIAVALGLGQEAGRDDPLGVGRVGRLCCQEVAGHLLAQELVVRLVGVEGVDDVVAVEVRLGDGIVGRAAVGVGVPRHVEPVPSPPLAVTGRGQESIDQPLVCVGRGSETKASTSSGDGGRPIKSR